ncbi:MAG TPA: ABC transporter ATP-binding protein [Solirubrobacteraceae bacterium]|nr:ABC transporter ATP-binding protein [Solirubrobacteraceae bacterium]
MTVLAVDDLRVDFATGDGRLSALAGVSFAVAEGEVLGLVGESGCGKSTLANAVMGLLPESARVSGRIAYRERDLLAMGAEERRRLRGDRISMVFQDPLSALDPTASIGSQVAETVRAHRHVSRSEARSRAIAVLGEVGILDAASRYRDPPHRFSGGMRQRVVIATALANDPDVLIADEPTTALDATIQKQILTLLGELRTRHRMATLLITHDLGVVAQTCDRVGVLYAGQLVELAPTAELFAEPRHPYTRTLLAALPQAGHERGRLPSLEGLVPDLTAPPPGCRFAPRCPHAMPECAVDPRLAGDGAHAVACWLDEMSRAASAPAEVPVR